MTKRQLAQELLLRVMAQPAAAHVTADLDRPLARRVCSIVQALHEEMARRADEEAGSEVVPTSWD